MKNSFKERLIELWQEIWPMLLVLAILCLAVLASGCKSAHDVPVMHDTTYINKVEFRDRYIHDSVWNDRYHTVYVSGDTVYIHDSVWMGKWKIAHDSIYMHDTEYVSKDVPVEVVKVVKKTNWTMTLTLTAIFLVLFWAQKKGILAKFWTTIKGVFHVKN